MTQHRPWPGPIQAGSSLAEIISRSAHAIYRITPSRHIQPPGRHSGASIATSPAGSVQAGSIWPASSSTTLLIVPRTPLARTNIRSSQSYPKEEDKTDDKEIYGHMLQDKDQGHQGQARWDKPMTMTQSTVPRTVPQ
jgi:hypothetical protein